MKSTRNRHTNPERPVPKKGFTDMTDLTVQKIHSFLEKADRTFPVPLSEKTDLTDYAEKLCAKADLCTVCGGDGSILSLAAGYIGNCEGDTAYISMLATLPGHRGQGLGNRVLSEFIQKAEAQGLKAVHCYAVRENAAAMKLYEKAGFTELTAEHDPRPGDVHLIRWLKPKKALVTAIGSFSADIVIKNLKKAGYGVVGTDMFAPELVADSMAVDSFYNVPKAVDEADYLAAMDSICSNESITHILPLTDPEVDFFTKYRRHFEEKYVCVCLSPVETIRICRDKLLQQEHIAKTVSAEITIPTAVPEQGCKAPFPYPMVCKPRNGRSSQGLFRICSDEDWRHFTAVAALEGYVAQPMIKGRVVTVDIIRSRSGKTCVAIPRAEYLRTPNGAGTSVKVYRDSALCELCRKIADAFGIAGCVNFEFLRDDEGSYHYLECNPRFAGGVKFSCIAGYDCVENHMRCFENKETDDFTLGHDYFIARKYEEHITRIDD